MRSSKFRLLTLTYDYFLIHRLSDTFEKFESIEKSLGLDPSALDKQVTKQQLGEFVESIKQKRFIVELMNILKNDLPEVYAALVGKLIRYFHGCLLMLQDRRKRPLHG